MIVTLDNTVQKMTNGHSLGQKKCSPREHKLLFPENRCYLINPLKIMLSRT